MDILCEGSLLVPPDRGTIIGRAIWKPRYLVIGPQTRPEPPLPHSTSTGRSSSSRKGMKPLPSKPSIDNMTQGRTDQQLWLLIYKQKDDGEVISQYPMTAIKACEIQSVQYRKPGPVIPTLIITFHPDPAADKMRRRRSSRTGGLSASNAFPNSLLFRTIPEERHNIYDWQITIQAQIKSNRGDFNPPMSPSSPVLSSFVNPFSPRSPVFERPSTTGSRPELHHQNSNATYTSIQSAQSRERSQASTLISPSPSLRSKSSNISSHASSFGRPQGYHNMLPIQQQSPADLPSPASTTGFDDQSILGWTSAQGRSSALSSHTRGSNSTSTAGTPPAPRETILDRAFMMRCIPGSDRLPAAEEGGGKLSSIARFEALMNQAEKRVNVKTTSSKATSNTTGWELEEGEEDSDAESDIEDKATNRQGRRDYDKGIEMEEEDVDPLALRLHEIPTPAQRALEYISRRNTPLPPPNHSPLSPSPSAHMPPQEPPRSHTTPPRVRRKERPRSIAVPPASPSEKTEEFNTYTSTATTATALKRRSSNSTKRLSFTEFTKRLSSTSSLLLVQANASSSASGAPSSRNSHQSSEASFAGDGDETLVLHRGLSQSRLSGMGGVTKGVELDPKRCGWRGSGLGVFGGEGGFL